jgi:prolyl oligopeptidase
MRLLLALHAVGLSSAWGQSLDYPRTRSVPVVDVLHGTEVADPYRWLENSEDTEVRDWVARQNEFTRKTLAPFDSSRKRIKARLTTLYHVPYYWFIREFRGTPSGF